MGLTGVLSLTGWFRQIHTKFHMFRASQDTACHNVTLRLRDYHPLWLYFPVYSTSAHMNLLQSYNPNFAVTKLVWAIPSSLAATTGITIVFSSSGYLDVSVLRVCLLKRITSLQLAGLPHSEIFGSDGYLHLPETYRSLSRPSSPL